MDSMRVSYSELAGVSELELKFRLNGVDRLDVDKSAHGANSEVKLNHNLYGLARNDVSAKALVVALSNLGYYMVKHRDGVSSFLWGGHEEAFSEYIDGEFFGGLYYKLQMPLGVKPGRVLVVFSSVADFPYNASIQRRCFFGNFKSISKFIPYDVAVLRISDIGGVVGSFYLNNNFDLDRERKIRALIGHVSDRLGVGLDKFVFYGGSKGGTGAFYHGVSMGVGFIAVDPIVSDMYHETIHRDSHFTIGTFPVRKMDKFRKLILSAEGDSRGYVLTSLQSPCFASIVTAGVPSGVGLWNVRHRGIKSHPDVGLNTVNLVTMLINAMFYGVAPEAPWKRLISHEM